MESLSAADSYPVATDLFSQDSRKGICNLVPRALFPGPGDEVEEYGKAIWHAQRRLGRGRKSDIVSRFSSFPWCTANSLNPSHQPQWIPRSDWVRVCVLRFSHSLRGRHLRGKRELGARGKRERTLPVLRPLPCSSRDDHVLAFFKRATSHYLLSFQKNWNLSSHQLNSKNNDPLLVFKTLLMIYLQISPKHYYACCSLVDFVWYFLHDVFFITLQEHFVSGSEVLSNDFSTVPIDLNQQLMSSWHSSFNSLFPL